MLRTENLEILNRPNVQQDAANILLKQCGHILIFSSDSSNIFSGSDEDDDRCCGGGLYGNDEEKKNNENYVKGTR